MKKIKFIEKSNKTENVYFEINKIRDKVNQLIQAHNDSPHPVEEKGKYKTYGERAEYLSFINPDKKDMYDAIALMVGKDEVPTVTEPVEVGEKKCEHEYGDMMLLSMPPQYRCIKCGETTTRKFEAKYTVAEAEPKAQESWEKEFDKQTPNFDEAFTVQDTLYTEYKYPESEYELDYQKVKDFISKALQQQKEGIVGKVRKMRRDEAYEDASQEFILIGYNQALSDILTSLESRKD